MLDIRRLTEVALGLYERSISEEVDDEDDENQTELRELMVDVGFKMHMLVQHLRDYRDQSGSEQLESHALQAGARVVWNAKAMAEPRASVRSSVPMLARAKLARSCASRGSLISCS